MVGSACAAVVCVATGTTANAIGVGGLPGILSIKPENMLSFAVCMAIAAAVPVVLTTIVGKRKLRPEDRQAAEVSENEEENREFKAFLTGKVITLKEVNDGVFSEGIMGDGVAIIPETEEVCAPVNARVCVLMEDSRHAVGLRMDNGMEILLHVGIDTVKMQGEGFTYLVEKDEYVKAGTPLIRFDRNKIRAAGYPDTTLCVITEVGTAGSVAFQTDIRAEAAKTMIGEFGSDEK